MKKEGITVQCVSCKQKQVLSFEEAAELKCPPTCDKCYMPMVAVEANVRQNRGR